MNKLPWIDALRGLAIFGVMISHAVAHIDGFPSVLVSLGGQGQKGVQLFYLVSAFTLFLSLDNRKKLEKKPLRNFFLRRFFRIAPLFYCVLAFCLFKYGLGPSYWLEDGTSITIPNLLSHITFLNGWNPYWINTLVPAGWSIAVEMPFYLIVPYLFRKIKSVEQAVYLTGITLIIRNLALVIIRQLPFFSNLNPQNKIIWDGFLFYWLPNQLPYFLLGIVLFFMLRNTGILQGQSESYWRKSQFGRVMAPLILLSLFLAGFSVVTKIRLAVVDFFYVMAFVGLALSLARHSLWLLVNSFWCYLGKISYSAYLIHLLLIPMANSCLQTSMSLFHLHTSPIVEFVIFFAILLAMTVAIGSLTYQFIELPGINFGRSLISRLESDVK